MEKVTIKAYAKRHKLSIFNVVKMIKSGELPTETEVEDDKEIVYVLIDDAVEEKVKKGIVKDKENHKESYSLQKENERLKKEIQTLKEEIAALKKRV